MSEIELKTLVVQDLGVAIHEIKQVCSEKGLFENDILIIESRWLDAKKKAILNLEREYLIAISLNKVRESLLHIIDDLHTERVVVDKAKQVVFAEEFWNLGNWKEVVGKGILADVENNELSF